MDFDLLIPAVFVAACAMMVAGATVFAKRHWRRELEQVHAAASLLGLERQEFEHLHRAPGLSRA